jgi:hypothetical protein
MATIKFTKNELAIMLDVYEDSVRSWEGFTNSGQNKARVELFDAAFVKAGEALTTQGFDLDHIDPHALEIVISLPNGSTFMHQLDYMEDNEGFPLTRQKKAAYYRAAASLEEKFATHNIKVSICR